jgi:hypothetical protein
MRATPFLFFLAGTALSSTAFAEPGSPTAGRTAPSMAKSGDEKVVCRYESVTGQLAGRVKRCMTTAKWRARARNARAEGEKMTNRGFSCATDNCQ